MNQKVPMLISLPPKGKVAFQTRANCEESRFSIDRFRPLNLLFSEENGVKTFNPDVPDFSLQEIKLGAGSSTLKSVSSASITIVTGGQAKSGDLNLAPGVVFYMSAGQDAQLNIDQDLTAYRAFVK